MYHSNSRLSFNEEQLLAHIPPEHTGEKYIVNKLRCMDYIAKHYTSLEQQIHNTYEIDQDFFFFCTPKTIFSLFFGLTHQTANPLLSLFPLIQRKQNL